MSPFVDIHTHHKIDRKDLIAIRNIDVDNLADIDVSSFYSLGIHPWSLSQQTTDNGQQSLSHLSNSATRRLGDLLTRRLGDSNFLALGETGLDRVAAHDFETQKKLFIKHIELSEQYNKPLIIHCVRAYPDIISIRKETKARQPWIIHGFRANVQTAEQLLRHEIYISLGDVLFKDEEKSKRLLVTIPSERLFLETDVSERNIEDIYEKAASIIGKDIEVLSRDIFNNFEKIFGKI
ncbi:MAG: TatD family hydrolase [Bacteroidales bacterium]|nr:TatD family hydrolase [Bacteroidales bacterium]